VEFSCVYLAKSKHSVEGVQDIVLVNARKSDVVQHLNASWDELLLAVNAVGMIVCTAGLLGCCCCWGCTCYKIMRDHRGQSADPRPVQPERIEDPGAHPGQAAAARSEVPAHLQHIYGSAPSAY